MWYQTIESLLFELLDFSVRFGGGDSFGGGGGGGGGFGGGGGGGDGEGAILLAFEIIRVLFHLCIHYPYIGIPLTIVTVIICFIMLKKMTDHRQGRYIRKVAQKQKVSEKAIALDALVRKDPNFNQEKFLERTQKLFKQAQKAWSNQNLKGIRNCLSSSVYERMNIQLKINQGNRCENNILFSKVNKAQIVGVHSDPIYDIINVQFDAVVNEQYINTETNKKVKENETPFTEYWSFIRRADCKTLKSAKGLIEGFCPNCGALLPLNDKIDCQSCGAVLQSGKYDWVLAEISQAGFFNDRNAHRVQGVHEYMKTDPQFNTQHMEDLASLIFIRYLASYYFADQNYLIKHTTNELYRELIPEFKLNEKGMRTFYHDATIGAVEAIKLDQDTLQNYDLCSIKVTWSGHKKQERQNVFLLPTPENSSLKNDVLVLKRKKGVSSNLDFTLISNHCKGCGAPESHDDTNSCRYCGRVQNTGDLDWILHDIKPFRLMDYQETDLKVEKHINAYEILTGLVTLAYHDGKIDEKEKKIITKFAKEHGLALKDLKTIFNYVTENISTLELEVKHHYHLYLKEFIKICIADGNVCQKEKKMIRQLLKKAKITDFDIDYLIKKERLEQYKAAKKMNKEMKLPDLPTP